MTTDTKIIPGSALRDFVDGYIECAVWAGLDYTETEEGGDCRQLDENYDVRDVSDDARDLIRAEVEGFIKANWDDCLAYEDECLNGRRTGFSEGEGSPWAWMGHDLYLTRNHHGCGFWDRGLPEALGERLTAAAQALGEQNLWPTAEGLLEVE